MTPQILQSLTHEQLVAVVRGTIAAGGPLTSATARELSQTAA
jgi:hypothetical protein